MLGHRALWLCVGGEFALKTDGCFASDCAAVLGTILSVFNPSDCCFHCDFVVGEGMLVVELVFE